MKARKRINKLKTKTKIQNRSARGLDSVSLVNQLFQLVLPTMVQTLPEAVLYMEKSNSSVEIDTVRKQGRLLPKKDLISNNVQPRPESNAGSAERTVQPLPAGVWSAS